MTPLRPSEESPEVIWAPWPLLAGARSRQRPLPAGTVADLGETLELLGTWAARHW